MNYKEIKCQIRDEKRPYAYCYDSDGERSKTRVLGHTYNNKTGGFDTQLQCNVNADHKFTMDHEGNVINE